MVVDDDRILTELLRSLLSDAGFQVDVLHTGEEAYQAIQQKSYACMLLDVHMPGLNGAELLMLMAAEHIPTPTLVIAAFHDFDEQEFKQFPNVQGLFHKPFYPDEVLIAVQTLIQESNVA